MTKRNIYKDAPLTRRVLSYFIDWYLGALCAAFPIAVVSQKLYGTMLKQNLLKIQQPYGFIAGILGVIFALFYYIYIPFFQQRNRISRNNENLGFLFCRHKGVKCYLADYAGCRKHTNIIRI